MRSLGHSWPTVLGPSLSRTASNPFEPKREAERLRHRIEALQREMRAMPLTSDSSRHRQPEEQRSESDISLGLSSGAVQELQGEIAALRQVLGAITMREGFNQPTISEVLPEYEEEEAHRGR